MGKGLICTISGGLRSVCNHPFLVGFVGFLIFLYRSSPFVFSLLVYASPVLVCTAILLGTLLSFGELNLPDVEIEEKTTHEAVSLKTGVLGDTTVVQRNESYSVERDAENGRNVVKQSIDESSKTAGKIGEIDRENDLDDLTPLIEESSHETELENGTTNRENRELGVLRDKQNSEVHEVTLGNGEVMQDRYSSIREDNDEYLELDDAKSEADSFDSKRVYVDPLDSPPRTSWKRIKEEEEKEEETEEDEAMDSGSDGDESSSPDASMADIIPMLDELHPLLDEDAPLPVQLSHDESDSSSVCSPKSSTSSQELDDEIDNPADLEVEDDDNQDVEDEEEKQELSKSAITWTEEDQKNLMDLGSSEIERNQQLEKLLARRKARKNMSMVLEKDLIDLESSDLAFNIEPISTTRQNPFDLPRDSYDNLGLPPIPGSAPSVLIPRQNPFDIPYSTAEDKTNLRGDGFHEEFMTFQSSEPFFQRVETFNVEPSFYGANRHERQDINLGPYFFPQQAVSEESSYSQFQGQSNELRNSKASSVQETESIDLAGDLEDGKLAEVHISQEEGTSRGPELISTMEKVIGTNLPQEPESTSEIEHVSENVGRGSQSSEEEESLGLGQVKKRYVEVQLGDAQIRHEEGSVAQVQKMEFESKAEADEQRYSRALSSSSLSEGSDRVFTETACEGSLVLDEGRDDVAEEPRISTQPSLESTNLNITSELVDDIPHKEPVYDSSPPEVRKNLSSSSMSSDVMDMDFLPVLVKQTVPLTRRDSEESDQELEKDTPNTVEMPTESSNLHPVNENDSGPKFVTGIREHDIVNSDILGVVQRSESAGASVEGNRTYQHDNQHTESQVSSASCDADENVMPHVVGDHIVESVSYFSEDQNFDRPDDDGHSLVSDANLDEVVYHESEKPIFTNYPDGKALSHSDNDLASSNKSVNEQPFNHHSEVQDAPNIPVKSNKEVRTMDNLNIPEIPELDHEVSPSNSPSSPEFISIPSNDSEATAPPGLLYSEKCTGGESTTSRVDVQTIIEDADEIKEIDEGFLSELDSIGDFNIIERGSSSNEFEKHVDSGRESLSLSHETGNTSRGEVNSNEVTEYAMDSEKLREEIDILEEAMESASELQTSVTNAIGHSDLSEREFSSSDIQNSLDPRQDELHPLENDTTPADSMVDQNLTLEDTNPGMPVGDAKSVEDIDSDFEKSELISAETEIIYKVIEKPVVIEPTDARLVLEETVTEHSSQAEIDIDAPVLEVRSMEDVTLDHMQVHNGSVESHTISDSTDNVLHVVAQGRASELHFEEPAPSEFNGLAPDQSEEGNMEKQLGPKSKDRSAKVEAHEAGSSKPDIQAIKIVAAEYEV
ncbi:unnamed protein product [Fraxinus pennsylvanica]|uniref:Uncharacterized protein n=1 Tax=Fraxinus pennsylvanica TaxID=56036 RepID=A0AAD2E8L9_9LAMI|nr:unnamed protein product [Fraxinus pennsylvanica]